MSTRVDKALMDTIGDVDGVIFWTSNFGRKKNVSFRMFLQAYQSYLAQTLIMRALNEQLLAVLLQVTIFESNQSWNNLELMNVDITLAVFSTWLKRYGPMSSTMYKCAAVSLPQRGTSVPWFYQTLSRESATKILEASAAKYPSGIPANFLIVLRYSSDPKYHFVVTTRLPMKDEFQHYPIQNNCNGYNIDGAESELFPTLVDCIQYQIFDKLFTKQLGVHVELPRDPINEWKAVFDKSFSELKENQYADYASLQQASNNISETNTNVNSPLKYNSLFDNESKSVDYGSIGIKNTHASPSSVSPEDVHLSSADVYTTDEKKTVGKYLLKSGLKLLQESGQISESQVRSILLQIK